MREKNIGKLLVLAGGILVAGLIHDFLAGNGGVSVENKGVSFGWFEGGGGMVMLVWLFLCWCWWSNGFGGGRVGIWMMLVGGAVNIGDRWRGGGVRDYWGWFNGAIYNNMADWLISGGLFVFILELWKGKFK